MEDVLDTTTTLVAPPADYEQRLSAARERIRHTTSAVRHNRHSVQEMDSVSVTNPMVGTLDADHYAHQTELARKSMERQRAAIDEEFQHMMQQAWRTNVEGIVGDASEDQVSMEAPVEKPVDSTATNNGSAAPKRPRSQSRRTGNGTARMGGGGGNSAPRSAVRARRLPVQAGRRVGAGAARRSSVVQQNDYADAAPSGGGGVSATDTSTAGDITNEPAADESLLNIVRHATRTQHRINYTNRVLGDKIGVHSLTHQSLVALKRDARPLATLVRNVGQTLRDVAHSGAAANTQLESTLCDTLHKTLTQWHSTIQECSAHMQRMQRFLEAMYGHLHQLTDNINSVQASFLLRQCHAADAAGHRAMLQGMIERREALDAERGGGGMYPTQLWGTTVQVQQLPMFAASRDICSTHASNSFKGINVEFAPRRRNSAGGVSGGRRPRSGSKRNGGAGGGGGGAAPRRTARNSKTNTPTPSVPEV